MANEKNKELLSKTSFLNDYFNHIYVVNLKSSISDRLIITKHLDKHGIDFEIFEATNGYEGEALDRFNEYQKQELGTLKRYLQYNKKEKERGSGYIESAGAMGYIYTYIRILKDAKKKGYQRFLILEDDILLSKNFEDEFKKFSQNIDDDWKVLMLGASQYGWDRVDINDATKKGFYFPRSLDTCGSFAIAYDSSIIDELIEAESAFEAPFDHLPMGELYEKYLGKCFVAYPNIVMPDVAESTIRGKRSQYVHGERMKWKLENFDYPLKKTSISIILTSKNNLKYYSNFSKIRQLPFNLRLYFNCIDGLRPLHNEELMNVPENNLLPLTEEIFIPESDYQVIIEEDTILTESDILKFIEYKFGIWEKNSTPLEEIKTQQKKVKKNRVSVIIPTYKRPQNLKNSLASVIEQDYHDIEIIVVSDNGKISEFIEETRQIVSSFDGQNNNCNLILLEHNVNRNGAAARNTGIIHSTGQYICFLDDDDIYLPGRLSKSIEVLKRTNKTVGAVYCGFLGWNSSENDLNRYKTGDLTLELLLLAYKKHYLHTNTATYKREAVLDINGFDESYRRHQDLEFNLRFFELYTIEALKEALVKIRPEPTNINNMAYDISIIELKQKFLNQFVYTIDMYDNNLSKSIYEIHWTEAKKFITDTNALISKLSENPKDVLIHILNHDSKNTNMIDQELDELNHKYTLLMKSISDITKEKTLKSPLKKISAYKKLLLQYYEYK